MKDLRFVAVSSIPVGREHSQAQLIVPCSPERNDQVACFHKYIGDSHSLRDIIFSWSWAPGLIDIYHNIQVIHNDATRRDTFFF